MEPKIRDGSRNLFRPCPQGSREGNIVLVQFNSMDDPENGGRFTVTVKCSESGRFMMVGACRDLFNSRVARNCRIPRFSE
jgi:hypothetical protein